MKLAQLESLILVKMTTEDLVLFQNLKLRTSETLFNAGQILK